MRLVKFACLMLCLLSTAAVVREALAFLSPSVSGTSHGHAALGIVVSLVLSIFWASALYGIQKRAPIIWRLGWVVIVGSFSAFAARAVSVVNNLRGGVDREILSIVVLTGGGAVALYWSIWWYRRRGYFLFGATSNATERETR